MTDQITVPRATWDAMREALETIIQYNRDHARDQYGDSEKAERWACVVKAREAITAANAVSAEPCTHCGAIHAKGMNTLCDDGEPQAQGKEWLSMQQVDRIVYMCREDGQDTTYDIVNSAIQFYLDTHPQATEPAAKESLTIQDIDTCRQWFDSVQDTNGGYLTLADYVLADKIYRTLGMRVPSSITAMLAAAPEAKQ